MSTRLEQDQITGSPLEREVARLQNASVDVVIERVSADDYALLRVGDSMHVAHIASCTTGRWECSVLHAERYAALYSKRFPLEYTPGVTR